jgi:hypothetical protein
MGERETPMPMLSTRLFTHIPPPDLVSSLSPRVPPHRSKLQSSTRTASTAVRMICSPTLLMTILQRRAHHSLDYLRVIQRATLSHPLGQVAVALLTTTSLSDLFTVLRRHVSCSLWTNQPSLSLPHSLPSSLLSLLFGLAHLPHLPTPCLPFPRRDPCYL